MPAETAAAPDLTDPPVAAADCFVTCFVALRPDSCIPLDNPVNDKKRCENCKKLFGPRVLPNGKTEYPSFFKKKRFCSTICSGIAVEAAKRVARAAETQA